jgi:adenosylmethionine-8-amino-7-oxononanoate aminotransferase
MKSLRQFFNSNSLPVVKKTSGCYVYLKNGRKLLDLTGGSTSFAILGYGNQKVINSIKKQADRFTHVDYKCWNDENVNKLSNTILKNTNNGLNSVYYSGNSGSEACEAALLMSYQAHFITGNKKKIYVISREQSFHGSTAGALSIGDRDNLNFYSKHFNLKRARIPMHHPLYRKRKNESLDNYAKRSAEYLEKKILKIGPENVGAFVGETIMGGLVGDVPPAPNYWKYIQKICNKYNVHLILDEVYCGTGSTGKYFCFDWDKIKPDFIFIGKTLAAGYGALSAVITTKKIKKILRSSRRLQHNTTHQGHSLSVAAALEVQKIVNKKSFLNKVDVTGKFMRGILIKELKNHPFFREVRGRGLRFSFEYDCKDRDNFNNKLYSNLLEKYNILTNIKYHRICFTPSLIISRKQAENSLDILISEFKKTSLKFKSK